MRYEAGKKFYRVDDTGHLAPEDFDTIREQIRTEFEIRLN